jgi:aminomuconate-semialdehyde/2-hydroxymuconate-6-semialdehyde dehydrogenase
MTYELNIKTDHFVGGKYITNYGGRRVDDYFQTLDPSNNQPICELVCGNELDIQDGVMAARRAFDEGPWPKMSVKERSGRLNQFAQIIESHAEELGKIESLDVGKLLKECIHHEAARASANIRFFAHFITEPRAEMYEKTAPFLGKNITVRSQVQTRPVGVMGLIVPWNSPLTLGTWKIAPALAAGNTCVIKPPLWAPLSLLKLGEWANEAGIPEGVLNIIPGGREAGEALVSNSMVDRISFTGSVATGHKVNRANAQARLAPVSLELGGKSPNIVFADCKLEETVTGVAHSIFRSQGQSCVAGSRLILDRAIAKPFMDALLAAVKKMKIGFPYEADTVIGPLITTEHLSSVEKRIEEAKREGARLLCGGRRIKEPPLSLGNYLEPTVFADVTPSMRIFQEEVFGPVLAITEFSSDQEALSLANNSRFGLSANIWTGDVEKALAISKRVEAGMVWVNSHFVRDLNQPFGGQKESGIGREGGRWSVEFASELSFVCYSK